MLSCSGNDDPSSRSTHTEILVPQTLRKFLPLLALCAIYLTLSAAKVILTQSSPYYSPTDETNLHFTENAIQYRYAKLIGEGIGIPDVDTRVQHPEGIRVGRELTIALERVSGSIFRTLTFIGYDTPFHVYSVYFIAFFSSLAVFPLYLAASRLWGGWPTGLLITVFYSVMPPAWLRTVTSFSREDFTLTFLFAGMVCFGLSQLKDRERWLPWVAGITLSIAAGSWHITNFVLVILFLYAAAIYLLYPDERQTVFDAFWPIVLSLFLAGLFSDLLRNKLFVTSTTMLFGYGIILAHVMGERYTLSRPLRLGVILAVPIVIHVALSSLIAENYRAYSHAFDVIYYKLRFALVKPEDPTLMTYDARGMWSSSFRSPTPGGVWTMFSTLLIVSGGAAVLGVKDLVHRKLSAAERFFLYAFFAFGFGYIFFDRIQVFFLFFAALLTGRWLMFPGRKMAAVVGLCAFIGYEIYNDTRFLITIHRTPELPALVDWVRGNTEENDVVLAAFHISPSILTYTNRPIVQHPKFESHVIRHKTERFLEGLFSSEEAFYKLAREWEADWYVYQASMALDTSTESPRYVSGRTVVPRESALFAFHFAVEDLKHFHLVHQSSYYRIFKIGAPPAAKPEITYQPVFDLSLFTTRSDVMPDDAQIEKVRHEIGNPTVRAQLAEALSNQGRYQEAAAEYERLVAKRQRDPALRVLAANTLEKSGRTREAYRHYLRALTTDPKLSVQRIDTDNPAVFRDGARYLLESGNVSAGKVWLERAVALDAEDVEAATNLGILYANERETIRARQMFERVVSTGTDYPTVYLQLGLLDQTEGKHESAVRMMGRYLELAPAAPNRRAVRNAIQKSRDLLGG